MGVPRRYDGETSGITLETAKSALAGFTGLPQLWRDCRDGIRTLSLPEIKGPSCCSIDLRLLDRGPHDGGSGAPRSTSRREDARSLGGCLAGARGAGLESIAAEEARPPREGAL